MSRVSKKAERCCVQPRGRSVPAPACPACGGKGRPVPAATLRHLVKKHRQGDIRNEGYYFCGVPGCDTVYYHPQGGRFFQKQDLHVRVGCKETEDPVWVCYCFDISKKMIEDEIMTSGASSFSEHIRREVAAGRCDCEIKNPSGRCCLGDILAAERKAGRGT